MLITSLSLQNFRNHVDESVGFAPRVNIITGPNGAGKTSLIDAIHYLCMTRSFVSSSDQYVVAEGEKYFMVNGSFEGEIRSRFDVSCTYSRGEGKSMFVNGSPLDRLSDLIGMVPVVVLSPEDRKLTYEGPSGRRAFIDGFISQISPAYLRDLITYNRVRRQRNKLLQQYRGSVSALRPLLEPWDTQLIESGARIVAKRSRVLDNFRSCLSEQFESLGGTGLRPDLRYETFCPPEHSAEAVQAEFERKLEQNFEKEVEREQTVTGPHRDEIVFYLGDRELRNFGSQGQHRLFSIALKLAQLFYYSEELEDLPIILLDDVFGNLDKIKTETVLNTLQHHQGQTFITSASDGPFEQMKWPPKHGNAWFRLTDGIIHKVK